MWTWAERMFLSGLHKRADELQQEVARLEAQWNQRHERLLLPCSVLDAGYVLDAITALCPNMTLYPLDMQFQVVHRIGVDQLLNSDWVHTQAYRLERNDCEDIAALRWVDVHSRHDICSAFVDDVSSQHAFLLLPVVEGDGGVSVEVIEPQANALVTPREHPYRLQSGLVLIK